MLTQLTLSQVKKRKKVTYLLYLVCPMWLHMSTSVDHPSALDLYNVNATFSQSANKDGDTSLPSPRFAVDDELSFIYLTVFNDKTITTLLVIICSQVGRDPTPANFIVTALSILIEIVVVVVGGRCFWLAGKCRLGGFRVFRRTHLSVHH